MYAQLNIDYMVSKWIATVVAVIAVLVIAYAVLVIYNGMAVKQAAGRNGSVLAVQLTDPPTVPEGTSALIVAYSSVQVHVSSPENQSGWVSASGNGTVNLLALENMSQTIAKANISANSTVNLVRFEVTSAKIIINNTEYNVSIPNQQINVAITGKSKINASSSAILIDFYPTVNAHAGTYMMAPAARAILVNANTTVSINTNIGSKAAIGAGIKTRLGLGLGIGIGSSGGGSGNSGASANSTNNSYGSMTTVRAGERISNFMVQEVNYTSNTVVGLIYVEYPVATNVGQNVTLHLNGDIGYACDNTEYKLTGIYANGTAAFTSILNTSTVGGCPI